MTSSMSYWAVFGSTGAPVPSVTKYTYRTGALVGLAALTALAISIGVEDSTAAAAAIEKQRLALT